MSDQIAGAVDQTGEDYVCAVADALEPDDEVYFNDRSRSLTVLGRSKDTGSGVIQGSDYPYNVVWLRGNGTEYRLRYSHTGRYYPSLHTESELEAGESFSIRHQEKRNYVRATTRGKTVRSISVEGVDDGELTDWALSRNLGGIEDLDESDTDADEQDGDST